MRLYIHVPFCKSKCPYCAFFSLPLHAADSTDMEIWEKLICQEMRLYASEVGSQIIDSIFFGGGTPSLVPSLFICRIINEAARLFHFVHEIEISLEANPVSLSLENALGFHSAGVNRISLGVQALDDSLLHAIGRIHGTKQTFAAVDNLRTAGFDNLGFDLMWGLPNESLNLWLTQLKEAVSLSPEHLSCYALTIEHDTPFSHGEISLPSEDILSAMYLECVEFLEYAGYHHYEISNFAKPDHECRHNIGYWHGEDYLGLGPSAVSTVHGQRWTQPADIAQWKSSVLRGNLYPQKEILTNMDIVKEHVMLRLRMADGLPLSRLLFMSGKKSKHSIQNFCRNLEHQGMATMRGDTMSLTPKGMLVSNAIIERFFEEMDSDA